jgi:hypothetical protein
MSVELVHGDDCERTGNWRLVRRSPQARSFGIDLVDMEWA